MQRCAPPLRMSLPRFRGLQDKRQPTRKESPVKSKAKREKYTPEFKVEAVRLMRNSKKDVTQLARELGVPRQYLHAWLRQAQERAGRSADDVFPGNGNRPAAEAEIARLRKELAQAKEDNEILKKATAFFAKESR